MVNANELRLGNLLLWNPKLSHPETTLSPTVIEVASVTGDKVGYLSPRLEHRAEPFEDDVLQLEPKQLSLDALEPIALTPWILEGCGFEQQPNGDKETAVLNTVKGLRFCSSRAGVTLCDTDPKRMERMTSLHQFQNLYFLLTGEEVQVTFSQPV